MVRWFGFGPTNRRTMLLAFVVSYTTDNVRTYHNATRDIQLFSGATECSDQYYVWCGHEFKNT